MTKHIYTLTLTLATALAFSASAGIFQDNSGLDDTNTGNWTSGAVSGDNIGDDNNWLASNAMHVHKAPYGADDGTLAGPGFVGLYKGAVGDTVTMDYSFTAFTDLTEQKWQAKGTIWRIDDGTRSGALQFSVGVNGGAFNSVGTSGFFGRAVDGADYAFDNPETGSGNGRDGPLSNLYTADLSLLNIQSGDDVIYRFTLAQDSLTDTDAKHVGIGVQLIPEPGTMILLVMGSGLLYLKRRRQ